MRPPAAARPAAPAGPPTSRASPRGRARRRVSARARVAARARVGARRCVRARAGGRVDGRARRCADGRTRAREHVGTRARARARARTCLGTRARTRTRRRVSARTRARVRSRVGARARARRCLDARCRARGGARARARTCPGTRARARTRRRTPARARGHARFRWVHGAQGAHRAQGVYGVRPAGRVVHGPVGRGLMAVAAATPWGAVATLFAERAACGAQQHGRERSRDEAREEAYPARPGRGEGGNWTTFGPWAEPQCPGSVLSLHLRPLPGHRRPRTFAPHPTYVASVSATCSVLVHLTTALSPQTSPRFSLRFFTSALPSHCGYIAFPSRCAALSSTGPWAARERRR
ncbi:hypothetical protein FHS42_000780 [Streptomyces zagrosensis]|uniref:Uncharacterized protein n=1 Tax=Streptomyces zagrosensis TaxID=1042984 RepID=A0A7W9Q516_9ACTN|nr:hypothetical protein [Streptomyces zagrosensis]